MVADADCIDVILMSLRCSAAAGDLSLLSLTTAAGLGRSCGLRAMAGFLATAGRRSCSVIGAELLCNVELSVAGTS